MHPFLLFNIHEFYQDFSHDRLKTAVLYFLIFIKDWREESQNRNIKFNVTHEDKFAQF